MAISVEMRTKIVELVVGMVEAAPGAAILSELVDIVDGGVSLQQLAIAMADNPAFKVLYPDTLSNAQFAQNFLSALYGSEAEAATLASAVATMAADLDAGTHRGAAMFAVTTALAETSVSDSLLGNAAKGLQNRTQVANYYSVTKQQSSESLDALKAVVAGVTSSSTSLNSALAAVDENADKGTTYTLGIGTDTSVGTSLNDSFLATIDAENPGLNTLVAADSVDGKAGSDTLSITASGALSNTLPLARLESIEVFSIRDIGTVNGGSYDFSNFLGETKIINNGSTNAAGVTFSKLGTGASLTIDAAGESLLGPVSFSMENSTDPVVLNLTGGLMGQTSITRNQSGKAAITVLSSGAANSIGMLDLDTSAAISSLTIDATTDLTATLGNDFDSNASITIKGSASLVDLTGAILSKNIGLVDASGLTSGAVHIQVNQDDATSETKFIGGLGDDILNMGRVTYSNKDITAVGGAGNDTLILNAGSAITTDSAKYISEFETLSIVDNDDNSADVFNVGLLPEIEKIYIASRSSNDKISLTDIYEGQARNIYITGNQTTETMTFALLNATQAGRIDTLELTFDDGLAAKNTLFVKAIEATGAENIILSAVDNINIEQAFGLTSMTSLKTSGAGDVSFTTNGYNFNVNSVIDVSGASGAMTLDASASKSNGFQYTGNANVDTVSDNSVGGSKIATAAGKDVITLKPKLTGVSGVVITAGADGDTIIATAAEGNGVAEVITLAFADGDTVIDTAAVTGDTVTGFSSAKMDTVLGLDFTTAAAAGAGHVVTFDTQSAATAVVFSNTAPVFGTTAVENGGDFYVFNTGSEGVTYVYQDTDGDKIIENGEFGIQLMAALGGASIKDEFSVVDGNLLLSTLAG